MYYRNISYGVRTYQGVTFQPGEVKEVKGYINDPEMSLVPAPQVSAPVTKSVKSFKATSKLAKSAKPAKLDETKPEIIKEESTDGKRSD